jgi:3-hydroxy-3-methylglutaryl CoA synthase
MIGITAYGGYVPRLRLDRRLIAAAWVSKQASGEIAVANYDEDALTMAVEAAMSCLGDPPRSVGGLYFCSTSSPYWEKQVASLVATACDLPRRIFTADFGGSARCGVSAMLAGLRAVQAGATDAVVVTAADVRVANPESELEGFLGDGAAAVLLGGGEVIAELVDSSSVSEEFTYVWRIDTARNVEVSGGKFSNTYGYERDLGEAIRALLKRQGLQPSAIDHLALYSPDPRAASDLAKTLGFDPKKQLVPQLSSRVGCTGSAEALLLLGAALDTARPGAYILVGAYGEGADALLFRVTEAIENGRQKMPLERWIGTKTMLPSYEKYLKYRRLIEVEEVVDVVTNVLEFKELKQDIRLYGSRCRECGMVQYPMAHVCIKCKARERLEDYRLGRQGTVFTFTVDHLIPAIEHPLPMVVVDLDGGGRLYLQATETSEAKVGDRMALTFRRLHEGGGNHNYYWKARPVRE